MCKLFAFLVEPISSEFERDGNASDEAMFRRYNRFQSRFDQPDPYDGSYSLADPQSFNRYAYVQNDPVNFVDPSGLNVVSPGTTFGGSGYYWFISWVEDGRSTLLGIHCMGIGGESGGDSGGGTGICAPP